jgi:putative membrane protein
MPLPLNAADLNFVNQAGFSGQAEVVLGRIAQQQGGSPAVRSFGAQMVGDHTQANQELASIAASQGATAPTQPEAGRQAVAAAIGAAAGPAFDAQYIPLQLADHDAAVALFQDEATTSTNESLRAYARKYLPVIQRHETMLRSMGTHVAALT